MPSMSVWYGCTISKCINSHAKFLDLKKCNSKSINIVAGDIHSVTHPFGESEGQVNPHPFGEGEGHVNPLTLLRRHPHWNSLRFNFNWADHKLQGLQNLSRTFDWCCFYYSIQNSLVALLEALFARKEHGFDGPGNRDCRPLVRGNLQDPM